MGKKGPKSDNKPIAFGPFSRRHIGDWYKKMMCQPPDPVWEFAFDATV